jgi:hypothetical protein
MQDNRHHNDAVIHLAAILLTRVVARWRDGVPYVIRDVDGTEITAEQGRAIVAEHHQIDPEIRKRRRTTSTAKTLKGRPAAQAAGPGEKGVAQRSNAPTRHRPSNQEHPAHRLTTLRNLVSQESAGVPKHEVAVGVATGFQVFGGLRLLRGHHRVGIDSFGQGSEAGWNVSLVPAISRPWGAHRRVLLLDRGQLSGQRR